MKRVRKGVFPAAGLGTRFLPATKSMPKEMLPIVDRPTIQYAVEEAIAAGIEEVVFVTGRGKQSLEDHFDHSFELEAVLAERGQERPLAMVREIAALCRVSYTRQKKALGLGHAVLCARGLVGDEPFAVFLADDLIVAQTPAIKQLISLHEQTGASIVAVQRVPKEQVSAYGVVKVGASNGRVHEVVDLVEKPRPDRAPSDLAVIGRYVLSPSIFPVLEDTAPGAKGEIQLTDGLKHIAQHEKLLAIEFEGRRYDTGDKLGFLQATVELALEREDLGPAFRAWLTRLAAERGLDGHRG
ncbi:MAG: UTP--glucose-1-phosphate uridylyltransferase GalU [Candidatus Polarisedimenticolia bacterium]|nr:UTP--glucose-1-phosphate uridylyltransferase GalU [bacterium]